MSVSNRLSTVRGGKAAVQDPTQCPSGIDLSTYFAPIIPEEIKIAIPLLHTTAIDSIKRYIKLIMEYLCCSSLNNFTFSEDIYEGGAGGKAKVDEVNTVLTAVYLMIRTALRNKIKLSIVKADLVKMNVPPNVVEEISTSLVEKRGIYETRVLTHRSNYPKLHQLRWRVDVIISSGSLSRVMRPNILLQVILKDGRVSTFEISLDMFNSLRYSVAKLLHEMQSLERHPIIRIVNEFKRKEEEDYNK